MPRHKIYDECEMPSGVVWLAKAICADYDRRTAALRKGVKEDVVRDNYIRLNRIVDAALESIGEDSVAARILADIIAHRGYERSSAQGCVCENSYYIRRRQILYNVAKGAELI